MLASLGLIGKSNEIMLKKVNMLKKKKNKKKKEKVIHNKPIRRSSRVAAANNKKLTSPYVNSIDYIPATLPAKKKFQPIELGQAISFNTLNNDDVYISIPSADEYFEQGYQLLTGHEHKVYSLSIKNDYLASAGGQGKVSFYHVKQDQFESQSESTTSNEEKSNTTYSLSEITW